MRLTIFAFVAICACGQSGIEVPTIGTITDSMGIVRPVYGVAGNFWLGPATGQTGIDSGLVLFMPDGVVFATKRYVILRRRDGSDVRFELTGVKSIAALGPRYAAIRAGDSIYAFRLELGREALYLLLGNAP